MKKTLGAVAALGTAALLLSGCTADDSAEIRVWLVGADTSTAAREYLAKTFADENPGSTVVVEEQAWEGLLDKLTGALATDEGPDVVEFASAQAAALTSADLLLDLSDEYEALGGDDLLPAFVEAGSRDGSFFAPPLYVHARAVFADPALVAAAPATLDEYVTLAKTLAAANPGLSGVSFAGHDWVDALPFIWESGGEVAVEGDGRWDAQLSSDASVAGLLHVQDLMLNASLAPRDGADAEPWVPYCERQAVQVTGPDTALAPASACESASPPPAPFVYALPGGGGGAARVAAAGSNIGVSAQTSHADLATKVVEIMLSEPFQAMYGEAGVVPAKVSLATTLGDTPAATAFAAAARAAKLTPASPRWPEVEQSGILEDLFGRIAVGGDVAALAIEADARIEAILNG